MGDFPQSSHGVFATGASDPGGLSAILAHDIRGKAREARVAAAAITPSEREKHSECVRQKGNRSRSNFASCLGFRSLVGEIAGL
jgi:hypothetical protein